MGFVLLLLSRILDLILMIVGLFHTIFAAYRYGGKIKYINKVFYDSAVAIDVYGNVAYGALFNDLFIKKGGYHYGQGRETVSSATGKNWAKNKLTFLGKGFAGMLNMLDEDHCWKAIEGYTLEYKNIIKPDKIHWIYTVSFIIFATVILSALIWLNYWIFFL